MLGIKNIRSISTSKNMYIILYIIFFIISCDSELIFDKRCMLLDPSDVKEGTKYQDCNGTERVGTMSSTSKSSTKNVDKKIYPLCTASNQTNCISSSKYKSIKLSEINPNSIKSGTNILGIEGRLPECSSENEIDCVTNSTFKSIDKEAIPYEKLLSSVSVLGEHGEINLCSNGRYNSCYINSSSFKAVEPEKLIASNIRLGVSLGGVEGSYGYNNCNSETHTGCLAVSGYPSIQPSAISSYLLSGVDLSTYGLSGSIDVCNGSTKKTGCYVDGINPAILAIDTTNIVSGNIKSGVNINGVNGTLFKVSNSNTSKLSLTGEAFSGLGSVSYPTGSNFVWFDKEGVERTGSVPTNLKSKNIKDETKVFGVNGNYKGGKPKIYTTEYAFSILNTDGSVVSAGDSLYGGSQSYYDYNEYMEVSVSSHLKSGVKELYSTNSAYAALKEDGSVVSWGEGGSGGDSSSAVGGSLSSGVVKVYPVSNAFIALKSDGSVVSWGAQSSGGNFTYEDGYTTKVEENSLSSGVVEIYSNIYGAVAALKIDGSVVTWGWSSYGGDSSNPHGGDLDSGVVSVHTNWGAFAALKSDGSVVSWGDITYGGDHTTGNASVTSASESLSSDVERIYSNGMAFAALKSSGKVVTWGNKTRGGNSSSPTGGSLSSGVVRIYHNSYAFAALKSDGSVVTWGNASYGGNCSSPVGGSLSSGVVEIYSTNQAFVALKSDGSVVTWGDASYGGNGSSAVGGSLSSGVVDIYQSGPAFAALKSDGSVVSWGDSKYGGDFTYEEESVTSKVPDGSLSSGVIRIYPGNKSFAALKADGSVVTWGDYWLGGNSSNIMYYSGSNSLSNIVDIKRTGLGFVAVREDGSYVKWGS